MATSEELMKAYEESEATAATPQQTRSDFVNDIYDKGLASTTGALTSAYEQNMSNAQASQQKIDPLYNNQANSLGNQYEINRRNMNTQLAANGLGTGSGAQAMLAQQASYNANMGNLRTQQANAQMEAQRGIDLLKTQYQNDIANATANNDYQRAGALYTAYQNDLQDKTNAAGMLAQNGDFSDYVGLYGQDFADAMQSAWNIQNPDQALKLGYIDEAGYKEITGKGKGGGGGSGGTSWYQRVVNAYNNMTPEEKDAAGIHSVADALKYGHTQPST